jgi:hypothetical protein
MCYAATRLAVMAAREKLAEGIIQSPWPPALSARTIHHAGCGWKSRGLLLIGKLKHLAA